MLVIRAEQMEKFAEYALARFEDAEVKHFFEVYPFDCRYAGEQAVRALIRKGTAAAEGAGYASKRQISLWIGLQFMLGVDFHSDPQVPWAAEDLRSTATRDATSRIEAVFTRGIRYLQSTAGDDCIFLKRAVERLRLWDPDAAPGSSDEHWDSEVCTLFGGIYPEKLEVQGADATLELIRRARADAAAQGLDDGSGPSIFALLACFFGSGFYHDPLLPWAVRALASSSGARALFEAGLEYLGASTVTD